MKTFAINFVLCLFTMFTACANQTDNAQVSKLSNDDTYLRLSEQLVLAAKKQTNANPIKEKLRDVSIDRLASELHNDTRKKAFWINVYNGYIQLILSENPELFEDRSAFYSKKQVPVAGKMLSFDDIEHGIIRGSKVKLSLGLLKDPFAGSYEKTFRVNETDGRIHFALNCGAKSCPYVGIYDYEKFNEQINKSCRIYLQQSTSYKDGVAYISSLFNWFRGDFGSSEDIIAFLKRYEAIPQDVDPKIEYKDYDWTLELGNFIEL